MSTGKVINPKDPNTAFATMGQVQQSDGTIYAFLNSANLKKDDPVLFEVIPYTITLFDQKLKMSVAVLHGAEKGQPEIAKRPWTSSFKERWDAEWRLEDPIAIERLNLRPFSSKLNVLLSYKSIDDFNHSSTEKR